MLSIFLKHAFKTSTVEKKPYYLIGDLNMNCLKYFENEKVSTFYNSPFEYSAIALGYHHKYFRWAFKKDNKIQSLWPFTYFLFDYNLEIAAKFFSTQT